MTRATRLSELLDDQVTTTVYIDADVDDEVSQQARSRSQSKSQLYRRYLLTGMCAVKVKPALIAQAAALDSAEPLVLQHLRLARVVNHRLRMQSFDLKIAKNDLFRRFVRIGLGAL